AERRRGRAGAAGGRGRYRAGAEADAGAVSASAQTMCTDVERRLVLKVTEAGRIDAELRRGVIVRLAMDSRRVVQPSWPLGRRGFHCALSHVPVDQRCDGVLTLLLSNVFRRCADMVKLVRVSTLL